MYGSDYKVWESLEFIGIIENIFQLIDIPIRFSIDEVRESMIKSQFILVGTFKQEMKLWLNCITVTWFTESLWLWLSNVASGFYSYRECPHSKFSRAGRCGRVKSLSKYINGSWGLCWCISLYSLRRDISLAACARVSHSFPVNSRFTPRMMGSGARPGHWDRGKCCCMLHLVNIMRISSFQFLVPERALSWPQRVILFVRRDSGIRVRRNQNRIIDTWCRT